LFSNNALILVELFRIVVLYEKTTFEVDEHRGHLRAFNGKKRGNTFVVLQWMNRLELFEWKHRSL
jgi:hypothetical protein